MQDTCIADIHYRPPKIMCRGKGNIYIYIFFFGLLGLGRLFVLYSWHIHCIEVEIGLSGNAQSECHVLLHWTRAWIGFFRVLSTEQFCIEHLDCEVSMMWRVISELATSLDKSVVKRFRLCWVSSGCLFWVVTRACFCQKVCVSLLNLLKTYVYWVDFLPFFCVFSLSCLRLFVETFPHFFCKGVCFRGVTGVSGFDTWDRFCSA